MTKLASTDLRSILSEYIAYGYLKDLSKFGIVSVSKEALDLSGFQREGLDEFHLFEQNFRLINTKIEINVKLYFKNGEYYSNGIDVYGSTLVKALEEINNSTGRIDCVELLYNYEENIGSLILNGSLELRFSKINPCDRRSQYMLTGLSSDISIDPKQQSAVNVDYARKFKTKISVKKFQKLNKSANEISKRIILLKNH